MFMFEYVLFAHAAIHAVSHTEELKCSMSHIRRAYSTRLGCLPSRVHSSGSFLIHLPACLFFCIKVLPAVAFNFTEEHTSEAFTQETLTY